MRRPPRSRNVETPAMMSPGHPQATPLPVGNAKMKPSKTGQEFVADFYIIYIYIYMIFFFGGGGEGLLMLLNQILLNFITRMDDDICHYVLGH